MEKRVVLISGCSSGIGRELAETMAKRGFWVYATARKPEALAGLDLPGIIRERLDVTSSDDVQAVMSRILSEQGRLDVLINNAGYGLMGPMVELKLEDIRRQFETNVYGAILLSQQAARIMIRQRSGAIVNIGSVSGVFTTPFSGAYCASKAALHAASEALRLELAPFGIRVLTVQPGGIQSRFGDNASQTVASGPDSAYAFMEDAIQKRAAMSQAKAVRAAVLANAILDWIEGPGRQPVLRKGRRSWLLPFLQRWLPAGWRGWLVEKQFGLDAFRRRLERPKAA